MEGIKLNGVFIGARKLLNFIEGTGITMAIDDDPSPDGLNDIDITINADGGAAGMTISRGGTLYNSAGITSAADIIVWRAPYAATVTNVRGFRVGGSGATVNARRNGIDTFLSSDLSVTSTNDWLDGGAVQNTAIVAGDEVEMRVVTATGSPTQVAVQIDMTRS